MIKAKIQPSGFVNGSYAVGLTIAGMSEGEISSVGKEIIVFISIKNEFDGVYSLKGYSDIPGTAFTGNFSLPCSEELWAVTSGTSSIYLDPAQAVFNNGSFTYITNVLPEFVIDKTSYKVTAVNARPGSLGFVYPFDASYNSHYDPNSKTLYVKYGIVPSGSGRTIIDTLTYCKAR